MAGEVILPATASAKRPQKRLPRRPNAPAPFAPPYGPGSAKGKVAEVYQKARQVMYPICRVCPACDGVACVGEFPGIGGLGFRHVVSEQLPRPAECAPQVAGAKWRVRPGPQARHFHGHLRPEAFAAGSCCARWGPAGNFRGLLPDAEYYDRIIGGCIDAGTMGAIGDGQTDKMEFIKGRYEVIARYQGKAIAGIKPRPQQNLLSVVKLAEAANAWMISVDIDSAGRYKGAPRDFAVEPKTVAQLREIVQATRIPVVVKGIMTPEDAMLAREAGAAGICVSNHGGRVLDHTPGTADVLPAIANRVKGKMVIFVDGCVHYGDDVLKYVALGADCVMVGRHIIRAAFGAGRPGVGLFLKTMREELEAAMVVTACPDVRSIGRRILA